MQLFCLKIKQLTVVSIIYSYLYAVHIIIIVLSNTLLGSLIAHKMLLALRLITVCLIGILMSSGSEFFCGYVTICNGIVIKSIVKSCCILCLISAYTS